MADLRVEFEVCRGCGYDISSDKGEYVVCPECGTRNNREMARREAQVRARFAKPAITEVLSWILAGPISVFVVMGLSLRLTTAGELLAVSFVVAWVMTGVLMSGFFRRASVSGHAWRGVLTGKVGRVGVDGVGGRIGLWGGWMIRTIVHSCWMSAAGVGATLIVLVLVAVAKL